VPGQPVKIAEPGAAGAGTAGAPEGKADAAKK